jgi:hypothetical protein
MSGDGAQATLSKSLCRICRTSFGEFLVGGELLFQGTADRSVISVAVHGDFLFRKILEDRSNLRQCIGTSQLHLILASSKEVA